MADTDPDAWVAGMSSSSGSGRGPQGAAYCPGDHEEACYEGRRIVLIPECELRVLLPCMMSQRADLWSQAAHIRAELDQALLMGWVPHNTDECFMRRRADQLEILMLMVEREARMSQAISHAIQRLLVLNPLAVINGPYL